MIRIVSSTCRYSAPAPEAEGCRDRGAGDQSKAQGKPSDDTRALASDVRSAAPANDDPQAGNRHGKAEASDGRHGDGAAGLAQSSYGTDPLPTPAEALDEPFAAFPSWFLRITCDRCGKDRMIG